MTTHTKVEPADRTALPRALIGRRPYPEYVWAFEIGDRVEIFETKELAVVVGRSQILGELDSFLVQIEGDTAAPLWLKDFEIETAIIHLIDAGRLAAPKSISVLYADTRMELPPLAIAAERLLDRLRARGIHCETVCAPMDQRFLVYMLGRGVPPPNNNTFRWCIRQIKVHPMTAALERRINELDGSILMITGVRQGESAIRDGRIAMSCGKDGAECGQGWYQQVVPEAKGIRGRIATLAPILHWRVCNVFDWLKIYARMEEYGAWEQGGRRGANDS
ncbi:hypothetical protein SB748_28870 [Rhizobium sp. SIMBA_035]